MDVISQVVVLLKMRLKWHFIWCYTKNKILVDFSKCKYYFVCQSDPKRCFRVLEILDDVKELNIRNLVLPLLDKTASLAGNSRNVNY